MQRISTSIDIAAPVERVWAVLMDFPAYSRWNPFIVVLVGSAVPGAKLQVTMRPEGGRAMSFAPTVIACEPNREFRWKGKVLVPGIFDGEHCFRVSSLGPGASRFLHEELFTGLLAPLIMRGSMKASTQAGFEAMNRALKQRAEGRDG